MDQQAPGQDALIEGKTFSRLHKRFAELHRTSSDCKSMEFLQSPKYELAWKGPSIQVATDKFRMAEPGLALFAYKLLTNSLTTHDSEFHKHTKSNSHVPNQICKCCLQTREDLEHTFCICAEGDSLRGEIVNSIRELIRKELDVNTREDQMRLALFSPAHWMRGLIPQAVKTEIDLRTDPALADDREFQRKQRYVKKVAWNENPE